MAGEIQSALLVTPLQSQPFSEFLALQAYQRNLSEAVIFELTPGNGIKAVAVVNPRPGLLENTITPATVASLRAGKETDVSSGDSSGTIVPVPSLDDTFLYAGRSSR